MEGIWDTISDWARNNLTDWTMTKVYLACAVAGGTVLIGQTGLSLFGLGGADAEVDPDVDVDDIDGGDSLNFLSIRALAGFLAFFGLIGAGGTASEWPPGLSLAVAFAAGASVMFFVAFVMRFFHRMHSEGNVRPENAVGKTARVYLRVPAGRSGKGKVSLSLQGRSMEFEAVTAGDELPTGSACRVVGLVTEDTVEVTSLDGEQQS